METNRRGSLGEITIKGSVKFFCFVPSFFARCCCQTQQNVFRVKVKALSQVNVFFDAIECGAWKRSFHLVWKQVPRENRFQHFSPTAIERVNLRELDLCQTDRNDSLVHSTLNSANLLRTSHDLPWQNLRGGAELVAGLTTLGVRHGSRFKTATVRASAHLRWINVLDK